MTQVAVLANHQNDETLAVVFQTERFDDVIAEAEPLLHKHWSELARNKDKIALAPDLSAYQRAADRGNLVICTCRAAGGLIGYACYFVVQRHLHYEVAWAISDVFWLDPAWRGQGIGRGLFEAVERALEARGVKVMHTTYKADHLAAGELLESMGHSLIEYGRAKVLGE